VSAAAGGKDKETTAMKTRTANPAHRVAAPAEAGRRGFLVQGLALAGAALAAMGAERTRADPVDAEPAAEAAAAGRAQGYRLTNHIRTYYETARQS
jgi:hypothetical protein